MWEALTPALLALLARCLLDADLQGNLRNYMQLQICVIQTPACNLALA